MSHEVRTAIAYHGPVAAAWLLLAAAYAFLAALHAPAAVAVIAVLFLVAALWSAVLVMDAEDWWNDHRGQKRLATGLGVLLLATLAGGVGLGWWITAGPPAYATVSRRVTAKSPRSALRPAAMRDDERRGVGAPAGSGHQQWEP
jgi:prepilin signal peptidase PulO-like enzyme (type II secretory pathway)